MVTRKRLFRSTLPKIFVRKTRKNKPRAFSEGALCAAVVGKIKKNEIVNKSRKKVDNGHPRWSLHTMPHKNRKHFHKGRTPEGGGGGRAKRSSIIKGLYRLFKGLERVYINHSRPYQSLYSPFEIIERVYIDPLDTCNG